MRKISHVIIAILGLIVVFFGVFFISHEKSNYESIKVISPYKFSEPSGYSEEIEAYVNFLKAAQHSDPVDYVMNLFKKYDIVVLCERNHFEFTQYELIYNIVSDKRFIEKSGYVFTEIGSQSINQKLNSFLKAKRLKEKEVDSKLIELYRDFDRNVYWEKYNLYDFFKKIYFLNSTLPESKQVSVNCSDMPIDWDNITSEKYKSEISDKLGYRDKIMADFIINKYSEIEKTKTSKKKFLVIMNTRHGFKKFIGNDGNTAAYLNEKFPGKVASVMINSVKELPGSNDKISISAPIQNGKWDAAFRYTKNINMGFDFENSPFGIDRFDYFDTAQHEEYKYQDIFNGFIFYNPLEKHLLVRNIPDFLDTDYFPIYFKRLQIIKPTLPDISNLTTEQINREINDKNTRNEEFYGDMMKYNAEIEQWLKY